MQFPACIRSPEPFERSVEGQEVLLSSNKQASGRVIEILPSINRDPFRCLYEVADTIRLDVQPHGPQQSTEKEQVVKKITGWFSHWFPRQGSCELLHNQEAPSRAPYFQLDRFFRQGSPGPSGVGWIPRLASREGLQKEKRHRGAIQGRIISLTSSIPIR